MSTKTVFTTGEAAKICKVSQQTIIRCFDNGSLKGFRVPGSRFRRIPRDQLYSFMKENGIPTEALESGKRKLLIVDDDAYLRTSLRQQLLAEGFHNIFETLIWQVLKLILYWIMGGKNYTESTLKD